MPDIIERLREAERRGAWNDFDADLFEEAADEISELREALKPFSKAMDWFERRMGAEMQFVEEDSHMIGCEITVAHLRRARAKLEGSGA